MTEAWPLDLLPAVVLAVGSLGTMIAIGIRRSQRVAAGLAIATLALCFVALVAVPRGGGSDSAMLSLDPLAKAFGVLIVGSSMVIAVMTHGYVASAGMTQEQPEELYALLLLATTGALLLTMSFHAAPLILGLELLSVSLYAMIGYARRRPSALEAALKYLVLASTSAGLLLFGSALLYAVTGSLQLDAWTRSTAPIAVVGAVLVLSGIGFKLAVVPFHTWIPDVFEGASPPIGGFVATVSKVALVALLVRLSLHAGPIATMLPVLAVLSIFGGALLALLQTNLRRLLAYSSVAQLGYVLVAIGTGGAGALQTAGFYMSAYVLAMLLAFGAITELTGRFGAVAMLEQLRGLAWRRPFLTAILTVALLSLAGLPVSAGFIGKLYIVVNGIRVGAWIQIVALLLGSAASIYYYLRAVVVMYLPQGDLVSATAPGRVTALAVLLTVLAFCMVVIGAWPEPVLRALGG